MIFVAEEDAIILVMSLNNNACIHGVTPTANISRTLAVTKVELKNEKDIGFEDVRNGTAGNRMSVMGKKKFNAYR